MKYQKDNKGKEPPRKKLVLDSGTGTDTKDDTLPFKTSPLSDKVTGDDSDYSMDPHDVDNIIEDTDGVSANPKDNDNENNNMLDCIIAEEYCEEEVVLHLPPIGDKLVVVATKWLCVRPPKEKVKEFFKQCMLPSNVEGLKPVRMS